MCWLWPKRPLSSSKYASESAHSCWKQWGLWGLLSTGPLGSSCGAWIDQWFLCGLLPKHIGCRQNVLSRTQGELVGNLMNTDGICSSLRAHSCCANRGVKARLSPRGRATSKPGHLCRLPGLAPGRGLGCHRALTKKASPYCPAASSALPPGLGHSPEQPEQPGAWTQEVTAGGWVHGVSPQPPVASITRSLQTVPRAPRSHHSQAVTTGARGGGTCPPASPGAAPFQGTTQSLPLAS